MGYVNMGLGATVGSANAPRPLLKIPVARVVRKIARTVPPVTVTVKKDGALSRKIAPAKAVMGKALSGADDIGDRIDNAKIAHQIMPLYEMTPTNILSGGLAGKKSRAMQRQYLSEWNGIKKRVADAITSLQPKLDKLNSTQAAFVNQIDALKNLAGNTNSQSVIDALTQAEESRQSVADIIAEATTIIDSINQASAYVADREANLSETTIGGKASLGPGSDADLGLRAAAGKVTGLQTMMTNADKATSALKSVMDSSTRIVNREAQGVLDQASVLQAEQMQRDYTATYAQQQLDAQNAQNKAETDRQQAAALQEQQRALQQQQQYEASQADLRRQQAMQQQQAALMTQSYDYAPSYNPPTPQYYPPTVQSLDYGDAYANQPGTPDFWSESPVAPASSWDPPQGGYYNEGFGGMSGMGADPNASALASARAKVASYSQAALKMVNQAQAKADAARKAELAAAEQGAQAPPMPWWKKALIGVGVGAGGYFGFKALKKTWRKKGR